MTRARWRVLAGCVGLALLAAAAAIPWRIHRERLQKEQEFVALQRAVEAERLEKLDEERRLDEDFSDKLRQADRGLAVSPPPPPEHAIEIGPSSTDAQAAREAAVLDLLSGRKPTLELPVRATDAAAPWDEGLRDRLAPTKFVSAPAPSPANCQCPPGDPLCSCF